MKIQRNDLKPMGKTKFLRNPIIGRYINVEIFRFEFYNRENFIINSLTAEWGRFHFHHILSTCINIIYCIVKSDNLNYKKYITEFPVYCKMMT